MFPPGLNGWLVQRLRTLDTHFEGYAPLQPFCVPRRKLFSRQPVIRVSLRNEFRLVAIL